MSEMREYTTTDEHGNETTMQLSERDAERLGAKPTGNDQASTSGAGAGSESTEDTAKGTTAQRKSRTVSNKAVQ